MPVYPLSTDYKIAVGSFFDKVVLDPKLQGGKAELNRRRQVLSYSGAYSIVFKIKVPRKYKTFALRCWMKEVPEVQERYQQIDDFLVKCKHNLPYFVDFQYVNNGIMVGGQQYPTTRMEWVEGKTLCKFVKQNLKNPKIFKTVADKFAEMVKDLHGHKIAHGDLQDGNIQLLRNGTDIEIKLIDYDSLYVPTLHGKPDRIRGLPEYQHPIRFTGSRQSNEKVDYFSELVIYLSFRSLAEKSQLWNQLENERTEKGLLFSADDFKNTNQSKIFKELARMSPEVQHLAKTLKNFCAKQSIDKFQPLEDVLRSSSTPSISHPPKPKPKRSQTALDYYSQGIKHLRGKQPQYAVQQFKKAIESKPNYKEAHYSRGLAHAMMKQFEAAENSLEQALQIDPNYKFASDLLKDVRRENHRIHRQQIPTPTRKPKKPTPLRQKSASTQKKIIRPRRTPPTPKRSDPKKALYHRAITFYNQDDLKNAKDVIEKALDLDRNYREARNLLKSIQEKYSKLGEIYENNGQNDKALVAYKEVIKIGKRLG